MRRFWITLTIAVALGTGGASLSAQGSNSGKCQVTVDRSQSPDVFDVTRQEIESGGCVCYIYTGPASQSQSVEGQIDAIVKSKSCPAAKVMAVQSPQGVTNSGFFGGAAAPLLGLGGIGAAVAASSRANGNSPVVPVSP